MKNLLNDAVRELVLRVNDEIIAIKAEIKVAENKGDKLKYFLFMIMVYC